jgi:hypothetical protein
LFLNSLWGKFGQRDIMTEYAYARNLRERSKYTTNENINVTNKHIIHENLIEIHYERNKETARPPDYVSPITAAFTTANARVRLAKFMKVVHPSQLLYCDTDSCYFIYDPGNVDHIDPRTAELPEGVELGNGLGQWEIELSDGKKWCCPGVKTYAVECVDPKNNCLKAKGITIDFKNKDKVTFDNMAKVAKSINNLTKEEQQLLLSKENLMKTGEYYIQTEPRFRFEYDKLNKTIQTCDRDKIIQNTVGLKRYVENNVSYPYGYEGEKYTLD